MKALVCMERNKYAVEEVEIDPPEAGELKIRMAATGVCHSDLSVIDGVLPLPTPVILGHGKLDLNGMVTATYGIDEAPQAFVDLQKGLNARGVIVF